LTEEQFLKLSLPLGVDHVRHGEAGDAGTVYVFLKRAPKDGHQKITSLAKEVWPDSNVVVVVTVPRTSKPR